MDTICIQKFVYICVLQKKCTHQFIECCLPTNKSPYIEKDVRLKWQKYDQQEQFDIQHHVQQ